MTSTDDPAVLRTEIARLTQERDVARGQVVSLRNILEFEAQTTEKETKIAIAAEARALAAESRVAELTKAILGFAKWCESDDGPLKHEWEESYIGEFENTTWMWEETLARIQTTNEDIWTDPSIKDSGLVALYRKSRAALKAGGK